MSYQRLNISQTSLSSRDVKRLIEHHSLLILHWPQRATAILKFLLPPVFRLKPQVAQQADAHAWQLPDGF